MTLIQPILIALLAIVAVLCVWSLRSHLLTRIVVLGLIGMGILFVVHPDFTNRIAHRLGVTRGADLLFYFFSVGSMYGFLALYVRQRALQQKLAELTRSLAIQLATPPPPAGSSAVLSRKEAEPDGSANQLLPR